MMLMLNTIYCENAKESNVKKTKRPYSSSMNNPLTPYDALQVMQQLAVIILCVICVSLVIGKELLSST